MPPGPRPAVFVGRRTGRMVALRPGGKKITKSGRKLSMWWFRCDCGNEVEKVPSNLGYSSKVPSCGCYKKEHASENGRHAVIKGQKKLICKCCDGSFTHTRVNSKYCSNCNKYRAAVNSNGAKMTPREYRLEFEKANGICGACGIKAIKLNCDHDHETGRFRAFLCWPCNDTEGRYKKDYSRLLKLYRYCMNQSKVL